MSATKEHHHDAIEAGQRGTKQHPIGWLNMPGYKPETWNPIVGCSKVSPGCDNCYALKMAKRIAGMERATGRINYRATLMPDENNIQNEWNGHTFMVREALSKPASWKSPRIVFVNSMGDLFHEGHLYEWIDAVFTVMSDNDQHLYILLTKRPENILKFWQWKREQHGIDWRPKDNVWIGVTTENQEQANKRIPILLQIPAAKRFVSIEPMLGPIDFYDIVINGEIPNTVNGEFYNALKGFGDISGGDFGIMNGPKLDWVICGGETGHKARPMHPDWVRSLRDQCKAAGTPFFFKQWGKYYTHWANMTTWEDEFKMYTSFIQFTQKTWVKKGDVLIDLNGKHCKIAIDMEIAKYPVAIMNPISVKCDKLDGQQHHEWPKINL